MRGSRLTTQSLTLRMCSSRVTRVSYAVETESRRMRRSPLPVSTHYKPNPDACVDTHLGRLCSAVLRRLRLNNSPSTPRHSPSRRASNKIPAGKGWVREELSHKYPRVPAFRLC
ncbi:hypothetical protein NDU88_011727 [Pleurodeles waltl]|uniref:Uncharacterized protein n=1 Tax=Pleurodeles waltl TaxID=8319 RepID=A0AAV7S350_PLEWA|nr:hypothetical protein NDU88_011727 [Pleurodeles waltl]